MNSSLLSNWVIKFRYLILPFLLLEKIYLNNLINVSLGNGDPESVTMDQLDVKFRK